MTTSSRRSRCCRRPGAGGVRPVAGAGEVRERYGKHLWCQQALLARRLVEAGRGVRDPGPELPHRVRHLGHARRQHPALRRHPKGLGPLLPLFDHLVTTLVDDLEQRGLLDETLVIAMGEFGRTPQVGTQDSTDGRNHWPYVMSMCWPAAGCGTGR